MPASVLNWTWSYIKPKLRLPAQFQPVCKLYCRLIGVSGAHRFTKADVVVFCGFQFLDISQILQGEDDQAVHMTKIDGSFQWVWTFFRQ